MLPDLTLDRAEVPAPTVCGGCDLGSICLCSAPPVGERMQLSGSSSRPRRLCPGEYLYRAGDQFRCFYAINSGDAKMFAHNSRGEERVVDFRMSGEALGLEALSSGVHAVSATALTETTVCQIAMTNFNRVADGAPEMQRQLLALLSQDVATHHHWLITQNQRAIRRVASFLVDIRRKLRARDMDDCRISLPMSRADIGSYLNLAHETVTRTLSELDNDGLIRSRRRNIVILEPAQLATIAGHDALR